MVRRLCLLCCFLFPLAAAGQADVDWELFLAAFFEEYASEETAADERDALRERLERLREAPLNLNACSREALLQLPFLEPAQADSILGYRERKKRFFSLGELLFVTNLGHWERRCLSLFAYCGSPETERPTLARLLTAGRWNAETRLDAPLYRRAGNKNYSVEELLDNPNRKYLGNGLKNSVKLRYSYGKRLSFGVTAEKDAGEPFGSYGARPYDFWSFHVRCRLFSERVELWAGDYRATLGQGLLLGTPSFASKLSAVTTRRLPRAALREHLSTDETNFLRGAAVAATFGKWRWLSFVSFRKRDAIINNDTVTSFKTDGLHRTQREIERRRNLGILTAGTHVGRLGEGWNVGASGFFFLFDHTVFPVLRDYSRHYFRGRRGGGFSFDYAVKRGKWNAYGEWALDQGFRLAATNTLSCDLSSRFTLTVQERSFSPRFASPFGNTLQEGSRAANEHALLLGGTVRPARKWRVAAYADLFLFPQATFRASQRSRGVEGFLQAEFSPTRRWTWTGQYRMKAKQEDISGYGDYLEYVATHRLRLRCSRETRRAAVHLTADGSLVARQTGKRSTGFMFSLRSSLQASKRAALAVFASLFFTDDYASRLYAYEPQLRGGGGFPAFAYHGCRLVATGTWKFPCGLALGGRYAVTKYFNRSVISSGTQQIDASAQNDLAVVVSFRLDGGKKRSH